MGEGGSDDGCVDDGVVLVGVVMRWLWGGTSGWRWG